MHLRCSIAAAAGLALALLPARAEAEWYGHQVLAADVGGWTLFVGGVKADLWQMSAAGAGVILLGGPIVHAVHDNYGRAGVSLGLRFGAPLLGFGIGLAADRERRSIIPAGPFIGMFVGCVAAAIADIAFVAREDEAEAAPRMFSIGGRF